jgi:hypothetical protein
MAIRRTEKKYECAYIDRWNLRKRSRCRVSNGWRACCRRLIEGVKKRYAFLQSWRTAMSVTQTAAGDSIRDYFVWIFGLVVLVIAVLQSCLT